ncbi:hypothetical protein WAI453_006145 [Rhynchosporium graminicola]|uniref:Uncharacterized protein n=1 Tax=Rhynchosporium graminicola TaxID=2792576 RepID=A0A1E1LDW3_9HELO|nr:uncharacterized protein RCO7_03429 [Rhynchosporium commune]
MSSPLRRSWQIKQLPTSKVTETFQTFGLDGASDPESPTDSTSNRDTQSNRGSLSRKSISYNDTQFWKSTKASRARAQSSAKSSRKASLADGIFDEPAISTKQRTRSNIDSKELSSSTSTFGGARMVRDITMPGSSGYIVLQYTQEFPHCKPQGIFTSLVTANNKVIELFVNDEEERYAGCKLAEEWAKLRGKITPHISEEGFLQYTRTRVEPKSMVWVSKTPVYSDVIDVNEGEVVDVDAVLMKWPDAKEMKDLWEASCPERRKLAGWR